LIIRRKDEQHAGINLDRTEKTEVPPSRMKDELLSAAAKQSSAMLGKKRESFNSAVGE
jgi:hypothetical protein